MRFGNLPLAARIAPSSSDLNLDLALQNIVALGLEKQYTHVIVTRSDYNYTAPHPQALPDDALFLPEGEDYARRDATGKVRPAITDRHTVSVNDHLTRVVTGGGLTTQALESPFSATSKPIS